jgi:P4 family phage/plasmid primase-like protien
MPDYSSPQGWSTTDIPEVCSPLVDAGEVQRAYQMLVEPDGVIELRVLEAATYQDRWGRTYSGYFDNPTDLLRQLPIIQAAAGFYWTINRLNPAVQARRMNRLVAVGTDDSTKDHEVTRRLYLPVDFDAIRPRGVSSTDQEHELAIRQANFAVSELRSRGWPDPFTGDSGNGAHLLYPIDLATNDDNLIAHCLAALNAQFATAEVKVDCTLCNPSRILRVYGTKTCKGDDTPDRPHRFSRILSVPAERRIVPLELLQELAAQRPAGSTASRSRRESPSSSGPSQTITTERGIEHVAGQVQAFIDRNNLPVSDRNDWDSETGRGCRWTLLECPFCRAANGGAFIGVTGTGHPVASCRHNSCQGENAWNFRDLVRHFEPDSESQITAPSGGADDSASESGRLPLTDTGLAERFAHQHGRDVRFCHPWKKFSVWDQTRWQIDENGLVDQLAKQTVRTIGEEAEAEENETLRAELHRFAKAAESAARREAMLKLVRSEPPLPIAPNQLDANPWLLNVANGTLDLRTGELRDHQRSDYITKIAPVEYDANAACPRWREFLHEVTGGDDTLARFLQRLVGYSLTGLCIEHVLPILHGSGGNGKTTLLNILLALLGNDYAMKAAEDLLLAKQRAHPTELADLFGKRFVVCSETNENRPFNEALVKELTGGERIRARRMREDYWEFEPTHKIWLATNHKPTIAGTDYAIWRRIKLIPFEVQIPAERQDKNLPQRLHAELSGILTWAVEGCRGWQRDGLGEPERVTIATNGYRSEMDQLAEWFAERVVVVPDQEIPAGTLYDDYTVWCVRHGEDKISQKRFGSRLVELGYQRGQCPSTRRTLYRGLGLFTNN